jgi:hypothetical protein
MDVAVQFIGVHDLFGAVVGEDLEEIVATAVKTLERFAAVPVRYRIP